jgi:HSP20 family protein
MKGGLKMAIIKYQPFRNMLDSFFRDSEFMPSFQDTNFRMPVDIYEKDGNVTIDFELPGLDKKDINIQLEGNNLTVSGKMQKDNEVKKENYYRCERSYGEFSRSFTLPDGIKEKDLKASFKDGVLKVTFPKTKEIETKKKIEIL